jgi:hypothetical protein
MVQQARLVLMERMEPLAQHRLLHRQELGQEVVV